MNIISMATLTCLRIEAVVKLIRCSKHIETGYCEHVEFWVIIAASMSPHSAFINLSYLHPLNPSKLRVSIIILRRLDLLPVNINALISSSTKNSSLVTLSLNCRKPCSTINIKTLGHVLDNHRIASKVTSLLNHSSPPITQNQRINWIFGVPSLSID